VRPCRGCASAQRAGGSAHAARRPAVEMPIVARATGVPDRAASDAGKPTTRPARVVRTRPRHGRAGWRGEGAGGTARRGRPPGSARHPTRARCLLLSRPRRGRAPWAERATRSRPAPGPTRPLPARRPRGRSGRAASRPTRGCAGQASGRQAPPGRGLPRARPGFPFRVFRAPRARHALRPSPPSPAPARPPTRLTDSTSRVMVLPVRVLTKICMVACWLVLCRGVLSCSFCECLCEREGGGKRREGKKMEQRGIRARAERAFSLSLGGAASTRRAQAHPCPCTT
jgi:hypothetical protein